MTVDPRLVILHAKMLTALQHRFEKLDDKLALMDCVEWCDNYDLPFPKWALRALAIAFESCEKGEPLQRAIFGRNPTGGRHSNPLVARRDLKKQGCVYGAVEAARSMGYRGDKAYEMAQKALVGLDINTDIETLRTTHKRFKRRGLGSDSQLPSSLAATSRGMLGSLSPSL